MPKLESGDGVYLAVLTVYHPTGMVRQFAAAFSSEQKAETWQSTVKEGEPDCEVAMTLVLAVCDKPVAWSTLH